MVLTQTKESAPESTGVSKKKLVETVVIIAAVIPRRQATSSASIRDGTYEEYARMPSICFGSRTFHVLDAEEID